jgi:hypothetical protein
MPVDPHKDLSFSQSDEALAPESGQGFVGALAGGADHGGQFLLGQKNF